MKQFALEDVEESWAPTVKRSILKSWNNAFTKPWTNWFRTSSRENLWKSIGNTGNTLWEMGVKAKTGGSWMFLAVQPRPSSGCPSVCFFIDQSHNQISTAGAVQLFRQHGCAPMSGRGGQWKGLTEVVHLPVCSEGSVRGGHENARRTFYGSGYHGMQNIYKYLWLCYIYIMLYNVI